MSKNSKININHIAKLANLPLTSEESSIYEKQLEGILKYVEQIESADTKNTEPTFNVSTNNNVIRKDTVNKGFTQEEALANTKNKKDGFVVTKGVFEND